MTQHTPGPWLPEFGEAARVRAQQDGGQVAIMMNLKGQFGLAGRRTVEEVEANARLIAAAPDLLEALIEVTATLAWNAHGECRALHEGPIMPSSQAVEVAKVAIAKATGSQA